MSSLLFCFARKKCYLCSHNYLLMTMNLMKKLIAAVMAVMPFVTVAEEVAEPVEAPKRSLSVSVSTLNTSDSAINEAAGGREACDAVEHPHRAKQVDALWICSDTV